MGNLVEAPETSDTLTDLDRQELAVLVWYQRNHPDELTPEAWARLYELQERPWRASHKWEADNAARWEGTLTPELVAGLERKFAGDEPVTEDEVQQWAAALYLTPAPVEDDDRVDEWYQRPLAESYAETPTWRSISTPTTALHTTSSAAAGVIHVQPRNRGSRARRAGAGRGSPSASDGAGESEPPPGRTCEKEWCNEPVKNPADPRCHHCGDSDCRRRRAAERQEKRRRRNGAKPRTKRVTVSRLRDLVPLSVTQWWHDCPSCGVRNYTQPPNGVPNWHVPSSCTACGSPLNAAEVAA